MAVKKKKAKSGTASPAVTIKMQVSSADTAASYVYDDDNPHLTDEQLSQFYRVHESNRDARRRRNVTLRLKPATIEQAKKLGKGYSGILSRIIEDVLSDPVVLEKYL